MSAEVMKHSSLKKVEHAPAAGLQNARVHQPMFSCHRRRHNKSHHLTVLQLHNDPDPDNLEP